MGKALSERLRKIGGECIGAAVGVNRDHIFLRRNQSLVGGIEAGVQDGCALRVLRSDKRLDN